MSTTTERAVDGSLIVSIYSFNIDLSEYKGTRAQLEAEDFIPAGTVWPEGGQSVHWEKGPLKFGLKRTRPEGMKGPMRLWLAGDYWCVRVGQKVLPDWGSYAIMQKKAELKAELFRQSPEGRRQWSANWERICKAREDKAFQAFKNALVPQRKKPGRPIKTTVTQTQAASARVP